MKTLKTSFPTGEALQDAELYRRGGARSAKRIKKRESGVKRKVGRSYNLLGTATTRDAQGVRKPGFFPPPITWGDTPVARDIRSHGGVRVTAPGKPARVEFGAKDRVERRKDFPPRIVSGLADSWSPNVGTVVKIGPTAMVNPPTTVGGGPSTNDRTVGRSPSDEITRFLTDGNNEARDLRRKAIVQAMIKAR